MMGYSRYDEAYYDEGSQFVPSEEVQEMRASFLKILKSLYGNNDIEELDGEIDYLCELLEIPMPPQALNVQRKEPLFNNQLQMINALERVANA